MNGLVYLCGPITGLLPVDATHWRKLVAWELKKFDVRCLSPMRDTDLMDQGAPVVATGYTDPMQTDRACLARDLSDIRRCDVVLVNLLRAERPSLGTAWEMGVARALDKPIVVAALLPHPHNHALLNESAAYQVNRIEEAIDCVKSVLGV